MHGFQGVPECACKSPTDCPAMHSARSFAAPPRPAGILYRDMYARDLSGTHVEMRCLRELVQHKLPRLAAHMDALACDMSILATGGCTAAAAMAAVAAGHGVELQQRLQWEPQSGGGAFG